LIATRSGANESCGSSKSRSGEKHPLRDEGLGVRPEKPYADTEEDGMGQTDRQTDRQNRVCRGFFTCTALPISLRVNLLAEAARETRFHARGYSVVVVKKEREAGGGR
jgi:hypothetical protein